MVRENNVEEALRILNGIVINEGILKRWNLTRRYEKPFLKRNRINFEKSQAIYNEDMNNRLRLIMRKNRTNPYPGTS